MFTVTGSAQFQAWQERVLPPVERVRPGLWSIPVPIPNSPLRYVLVYAFELPDGLALVDAGWDTPEAWDALVAGLATAGGKVEDVRAVLVTHIHPDHYGLAGRVRAASGAWIGLHAREAETLPGRYGEVDELIEKSYAWLLRCGVPAADARTMAGSSRELLPLVHLAEPDRLLDHGDPAGLPGWDLRAVWTPGHTPGHLCFYEPERQLLLSGDHVLPRISPNISVHPQQPINPLGAFLDTFDRLAALDVGEVLPAHEYRFAGLADRLDQMRRHHESRLAELLRLIGAQPGATTWELAQLLTWSRPWDQIAGYMRRAAIGETLAHLTHLRDGGAITSVGDPMGWSLVE
ncbi:MAG TPA: MBL fold metallo-hydrolase [Rugosimonospora sp.]|nr:MBL fold metallo-hydrolase [Rugosimonospora sp.]